jgi:hypothetical protein
MVAVVALLSVAACSERSTPQGVLDPSGSSGDPPGEVRADQLVASCGGAEFESVPADPSTLESANSVWNELDLTEIGMEADFFDLYDWWIVTQTPEALDLFGTPIEPLDEREANADGEPGYGYVSAVRETDHWKLDNWGQCRIQLTTPDFGPARFILDPDQQPDPAATSIAVLVTEMSCASGEPPDGRAVESVVVDEDDSSVSIVVLVEPPTGASQTCPGNPSVPYNVELASPLDGRTVFDGGVQPAIARPWPPTESSIESRGLTE